MFKKVSNFINHFDFSNMFHFSDVKYHGLFLLRLKIFLICSVIRILLRITIILVVKFKFIRQSIVFLLLVLNQVKYISVSIYLENHVKENKIILKQKQKQFWHFELKTKKEKKRKFGFILYYFQQSWMHRIFFFFLSFKSIINLIYMCILLIELHTWIYISIIFISRVLKINKP